MAFCDQQCLFRLPSILLHHMSVDSYDHGVHIDGGGAGIQWAAHKPVATTRLVWQLPV